MKWKYFLALGDQKSKYQRYSDRRKEEERAPPDRSWGYLWGECSPSQLPKVVCAWA